MMSKEQKAYVQAKALYDTLREDYLKKATELEKRHGGEMRKALAIERYADEIGFTNARIAIWNAEKDLLNWARSKVRHLSQYKANAAEIEKVYASPILSIRKKVIDLSLRLDA